MKVRIAPALLGGVAALLMAGTAQAAPAEYYFQCQGDSPNQVQTFTASGPWTWSAEKPTASYQDGAGCGYADTWIQGRETQNYVYDAVFGGDYAGEVRRLGLSLYHLAPNPLLSTKDIDVTLEVDGVVVFQQDNLAGTSIPSDTGASAEDRFVIDGLNIPASTVPKSYVLTVTAHWTDDPSVWIFGAKEFPAGVTLFSLADLQAIGEAPIA